MFSYDNHFAHKNCFIDTMHLTNLSKISHLKVVISKIRLIITLKEVIFDTSKVLSNINLNSHVLFP